MRLPRTGSDARYAVPTLKRESLRFDCLQHLHRRAMAARFCRATRVIRSSAC
jgi:hypothetical protein